MPYATIADVFARYRPIKTVVGSSDTNITSVDVSSIYIRDQESIVDAYLSRRYTTPLDPIPPVITHIASDLTIFHMLVEKLPEVPDFMQSRYDRSIKLLEMFRDGEMDVQSATLVSTGDQEAWSSTQNYHPVFNPVLDPVDQKVDKDQVDAAKDDRTGD